MSTALYRRYRPEAFADVIGQEHVTEPLMQALRSGRISHAYLFSGPRGCGKTTSARILARCLNCEQGPTDTPCGTCESCVALARGGSGSVDVIEIDAASHGGVDDARDLREKASYGPARSRFKVYIIDEAHMVTPQGFNALLKIVEEPPEHVKFVFATTEPEKVIGTIRSRTHHYPFRLVPPARLTDYLQQLCDTEGVKVAPGVLSFVIRAGGGSVRDSLSVLDQLMAGAGDEGLTYERAAALLGFTEVELLDATVDALAAGDGASVFRQVDRVIESGQDPRRFLEDLLERLRDLIVVLATGEGAGAVLRGAPEDQLERMRAQAAAFGGGALSRAADVVNTGLTEMTGATSPRLQLELVCARLLLPGAVGEQGYAARLDRLERRLELGGHPGAAASPLPTGGPTAAGGRVSAVADQGVDQRESVAASAARVTEEPLRPAQAADQQPPASGGVSAEEREALQQQHARQDEAQHGEQRESAAAGPAGGGQPGGAQPGGGRPCEAQPGGGRLAAEQPGSPQRGADHTVGRASGAARPAAAPGGVDADMLRRAWPDVLARVFREKRVTWTMLSEHAQVLEFDGRRVVLGINNPGVARNFSTSKVHPEVVRQALIDVIGVDAVVEGVPLASHAAEAPRRTTPPQAAPPPRPTEAPAPPAGHGPADRSGTTDRTDTAARNDAPHGNDAPDGNGGAIAGAAARAGAPGGAAGGGAAPSAGSPGLREALGVPDRAPDPGGGWEAGGPAPDWATAGGPDTAGDGEQPGGEDNAGGPGAATAPPPPRHGEAPGGDPDGGTGDGPDDDTGDGRGDVSDDPGPRSDEGPQDDDEPVDEESVPVDVAALSPYQRAMQRARREEERSPQVRRVSDDDVSRDDESVDDAGGTAGPQVIASVLGGTIISDSQA
ncbi:DNA polymerase III subunit gamma and tau [Arsenicicoccus sp. oral taxon 190]|uniref:DNA polymerase III subunit gamma and tau n=1 Tax=Arsenicicoccus sp. oral taxon 190 TaxID=1658671 RepID=UPI00067A387D|nr:DNA polymerase III subunit gamma and tau [Arsenicicoccus sp. oral taxon 190]AKT50490.1 hypothetical protein ADJ73_02700 [Arsenicicoccus sp. oral taxon 190]